MDQTEDKLCVAYLIAAYLHYVCLYQHLVFSNLTNAGNYDIM